MRHTAIALLICLTASFGLAAPVLAVEMLSNGGFENEPNWNMGAVGNDVAYSAFITNQIPGWTIETGHAVTVHNTVAYPYITAQYSANLDGSEKRTLLAAQGNLTGIAYVEIS